jgi:hypothetical protein
MNQHAAKLTEGVKAMMKKWPDYRIDVYKTHRVIAFPENVLKNTAKCALTAKTADGGITLEGARACIPFPIPKTGSEVMWNHLTCYKGYGYTSKTLSWLRDRNGKLILSDSGIIHDEFPFWAERPRPFELPYYAMDWSYSDAEAPARNIGQASVALDPLNLKKKSRLAYFYMPGLRRVRLAPEFDYDTPIPSSSGSMCNDEAQVFNGSLEKYDWVLMGKKEIYIPYNDYRAGFWAPPEQLFGPHYLNPDVVRWELHRVWVVEARLKKGERHIYPLRRFYVDEDSWRAHAAEMYDAHGTLVNNNFAVVTQLYDKYAQYGSGVWNSNLLSGISYTIMVIGPKGYVKIIDEKQREPETFWSPENLSSASAR